MARVLIVFEPPDGGVATHVSQLARGLGEHGHEVEVAGPPESIVHDELCAAGIPVRGLPLRRDYAHPHHDARAVVQLTRLVRRGGFDLVHGHAAKAGVIARLAARAAGRPAVYTPHCFPFVGEMGAPRRVFGLAAERALAPLTAATICVSEDERRVALARGAGRPDRLVVVHNGTAPCDPAVVPDAALRAHADGGPIAAAVTVLRRQKSIETLLGAAPLVFARVPDARIAVVGEGPERDRLVARAAELGLDRDPRFAFLPFTPPAARYLAAMDVFVLPSAWEAFPIGILEALACGVPQVATAVGGTPEAVTPETGELVPPHDPEALAAALAGLLADPERRRAAAEASRARHAQRFGLERMVRETAAVYAGVVTPGRSRRRASSPSPR